MTRSENQLGPGCAKPDPNSNRPELNGSATPSWAVQPESRVAAQGNWDYNPFYLTKDLEQRLAQLEQEAVNSDRQQKHLAETEQTTKAQLELAANPDRERLVEQLTKIGAELNRTRQELEKINWGINCLKAELNGLCQEINRVYNHHDNSSQVSQAAQGLIQPQPITPANPKSPANPWLTPPRAATRVGLVARHSVR